MASFTDIFGGSTIYPAQPTFIQLSLSTNIVLSWPIEIAPPGVPVVAEIIEVTTTTGGLTISLEDARQTSTGYTALFNNIGANTFTVLDALGNVLMAVPSGQVWQIYLANNSTIQGTFRVFQYGAGVSSANAAALAGAGLKAITTTLNERIAINAKSADYVIVNGDRANCIEWIGGTGNFTLPNAATVGSDWFCLIKNNGTGIVTVTPPSGTIDQSPSLAFAVDNSAIVVTDGTNYFTIGFGQAINSVFDFLSIDLTGASGNVVLAGAQLNRISYRFIGALAGNVSIVVPNTVQQYWIDNETTGAFSLTVKTAAVAGIAVSQGTRNILYSDGTTVLTAVTFGSTGFTNGSAAAPSIFFTAHPDAGFYVPAGGTSQIGAATSGLQRLLIDPKGHWTIEQPDTTTSPTFTIEGPFGSGIGLQVGQQLQSAVSPVASFLSNGINGFCVISIASSNAVIGTSDLSIFQTDTNECVIYNRANSLLRLGTSGVDRLVINGLGALALTTTTSPTATAGGGGAIPGTVLGYLSLSINGTAVKIPYYSP